MPGMYPVYPDTPEGHAEQDIFMNFRLGIFLGVGMALPLISLAAVLAQVVLGALMVAVFAAGFYLVFRYNFSNYVMTRFFGRPVLPKPKN